MRCVVVLLVALGCGDSSGDEPLAGTAGMGGSAGPGGAGGATAGGASTTVPPPPDAATPPADASFDGAASARDAGPVEVTPETLHPLATGNRWTYQTTWLSASAPCPEGRSVTEIHGVEQRDARDAFLATHFCVPDSFRSYAFTDAGLEVQVGSDWAVAIPRPVVEGATNAEGDSFHRVGEVTVAAGTFGECWESRAELVEIGPVQTYCHGVGTVLVTRTGTVAFRSELVEYELH